MLLKDYLIQAGFLKRIDTVYTDAPKIDFISGPLPLVPQLDAFCPGVSIQLLELFPYRNIRALCLTNLVGYDQIDYLLNSLTVQGGPTCLEDL